MSLSCWHPLPKAIQPGSIHQLCYLDFNFLSCKLNQSLFFVSYKHQVFCYNNKITGLILMGKLALWSSWKASSLEMQMLFELARVHLNGYIYRNRNSDGCWSTYFVASTVVSTKKSPHTQTQTKLLTGLSLVEPDNMTWSVISNPNWLSPCCVCSLPTNRDV